MDTTGIEAFSATQEIDDPIYPCQQGNLFYLDMPQEIQDKLSLSFSVNGERTPTLAAETPYRHLNTPEGTTGALQCYIQGKEHTLIADLSEAESIATAEDLKVIVGTEPPSPEMIAQYNRLERVKELLKNNGNVKAPVTTGMRIEALESNIRSGLADNEAQEELLQIARTVENQTGNTFLMPTQTEIMAIEMVAGQLPPGQYDLTAASEDVLDKIGDAILGVFDESLNGLLDKTWTGAKNHLPAVFLELFVVSQALDEIADQHLGSIIGSRDHTDYRRKQLANAVRNNHAARVAFKKAFFKAILKAPVVNIKLFSNGSAIVSFKTFKKVRLSFGSFNLRAQYKTNMFEASAKIQNGKFASVAGDAFRGMAIVGVGLVVFSEVKTFYDTPDADKDWSDLFVSLGVEMAKIAISAIVGAALSVVITTGAGFLVGFTLPFWVVIFAGIGVSIIVGMALEYIDGSLEVKGSIQRAVNSLEPMTRNGDSIRW